MSQYYWFYMPYVIFYSFIWLPHFFVLFHWRLGSRSFEKIERKCFIRHFHLNRSRSLRRYNYACVSRIRGEKKFGYSRLRLLSNGKFQKKSRFSIKNRKSGFFIKILKSPVTKNQNSRIYMIFLVYNSQDRCKNIILRKLVYMNIIYTHY